MNEAPRDVSRSPPDEKPNSVDKTLGISGFVVDHENQQGIVMGVILDTNYRIWNAAKQSDDVGWPQGSPTEPWAYQRIAAVATEFANAGFSVIKLPPSCLGGAGIFSDGYDKYDDYMLDGTAFGSAEMLRQCIGAINAHGMAAYGDLVLHQYGGGKDGVYLTTPRFAKTPTCFSGPPPRVAADPVPDAAGNFAFGDRAAYVHSLPAGYMHDGAIAATEFLAKTAGFAGFRLDDVKGTNAQVIWDMLHTAGVLSDIFAVGEYFDGNPVAVANWVNGYMTGRASVYDFAFKFNVGDICNNSSRRWMGALADIGYVARDAYRSVTFIESADSDNSPGQQTIWNKILGYAIMLTFPGYPQVYYRDWADDPGCYGLKKWINNLIWIHETLAQGEFVVRLDTHEQVFVHERLGHGHAIGCVCFFNNDQYHTHTVTVQTSLGPWQEVHEYTGNGPYNNIWTDGLGRLTATVPRNDNGQSYLVYAKPLPHGGLPLMWTPRFTQQTFYGANDLNIPAASNVNRLIGRLDIAAGSPVTCTLSADHTGWADHSTITFQLVCVANPSVNPAGGATLDVASSQATSQSSAALDGWYEIHITGAALPPEGAAFELTVSYLAPQTPSADPQSW
jgi:alpha-amylase